jgi:hypothetical protein
MEVALWVNGCVSKFDWCLRGDTSWVSDGRVGGVPPLPLAVSTKSLTRPSPLLYAPAPHSTLTPDDT